MKKLFIALLILTSSLNAASLKYTSPTDVTNIVTSQINTLAPDIVTTMVSNQVFGAGRLDFTNATTTVLGKEGYSGSRYPDLPASVGYVYINNNTWLEFGSAARIVGASGGYYFFDGVYTDTNTVLRASDLATLTETLSIGQCAVAGITTYNSFFNIHTNGHVTLTDFATYWKSIFVDALSMHIDGVADPTFGSILASGGLKGYSFPGDAAKSLYFTVNIPANFKEGSDITPRIRWMPATANAGNVVWSIEYSWANIDGTHSAIAPLNVTCAAPATAWKNTANSTTAITSAPNTIYSQLICRVFRDAASASDTYADGAILLGVEFQYESDSFGADTIDTK